ncbi:MAG: ParA family protein [Pseudomonadota bacterium]
MTMCNVLTITNPNGGSGKTVTALNLAASLALFGKRTLLVDCDPCAGATACSGKDAAEGNKDISSVLSGKCGVMDAACRTDINRLFLLPSSLNLLHVSLKLSLHPGNEKMLRLFLEDVKDSYDYIIIDSPSSHSFLTLMAMAAADWLIVPMQCRKQDQDQLNALLRMIQHIRTRLQVRLKIAGLLFCNNPVLDAVDGFLSTKEMEGVAGIVYPTRIPCDDTVVRAAETGRPVALMDVGSPGAKAYLDFAREVISFFN